MTAMRIALERSEGTSIVRNLTRSFLLVAILLISPRAVPADVERVADEIRIEATRTSETGIGHPLPLASHWTTGIHPISKGWSPIQQMKLIEQGHHLLPWFQLP